MRAMDNWLKQFLRYRAAENNLGTDALGWLDIGIAVQKYQAERPGRFTDEELQQMIQRLALEARTHGDRPRVKYAISGQRIRALKFVRAQERSQAESKAAPVSLGPPPMVPSAHNPDHWVEVLAIAKRDINVGTAAVRQGDLLRVAVRACNPYGVSTGTVGDTGAAFQIPRDTWRQVTEAPIHGQWSGAASSLSCVTCKETRVDMFSTCCGTPAHMRCWQSLGFNGSHICPCCLKTTQQPQSPVNNQPSSSWATNSTAQVRNWPQTPYDNLSDSGCSSNGHTERTCYCPKCYKNGREATDDSTNSCQIHGSLARTTTSLAGPDPTVPAMDTATNIWRCYQCLIMTDYTQRRGTGAHSSHNYCNACWWEWNNR